MGDGSRAAGVFGEKNTNGAMECIFQSEAMASGAMVFFLRL
jgi:hypothetical protein